MSDPFDGAGEPYKGSTYRGWILVAIVVVVVVVLLWLAYGEALDLLPAGTSRPLGRGRGLRTVIEHPEALQDLDRIEQLSAEFVALSLGQPKPSKREFAFARLERRPILVGHSHVPLRIRRPDPVVMRMQAYRKPRPPQDVPAVGSRMLS